MKPNHLFWKFMHHLVVEKNARMIEVSPDKKQIWLELSEGRSKALLRMARVEYDWMNDVTADMDQAYQTFHWMKRRIPARKPDFYNIYVSTYPPVDLTSPLKEQENKEGIHHFFMADDGARQVADQPEDILMNLKSKRAWTDIPEGLSEEEHRLFARQYRNEVIERQDQLDQRDRSLLLHGKPRFTYTLLAAILIAFFMIEQAGGSTDIMTLIEFGAKYNPAILEGEWWRLITAMFLHIGFLHLFMNSLALFYLGAAVESMFGTIRFIIIYFTAGLFGSLASFAFNDQVSAGASGAIFGCFGALLYFGLIYKQLFFRTMGLNVFIILAINLSLGFMIPAIDNGAHIGGLLGGFLASAFVHLPKHALRGRQVFIFLLSIVAAVALYGYGLVNDNKTGSINIDLQMAQEHIQEGRIPEAEEILETVLKNQENAQAYFLLGNVFVQKNDYKSAMAHFEEAIAIEHEFPEAHYNLALVYLELGKIENAENALKHAKETNRNPIREQLDIERVEELLEEARNH